PLCAGIASRATRARRVSAVSRPAACAARAQEAVVDAGPIRGRASSGMATQNTPKTRVATPAPSTPESPASRHRTRHSTKNVAATVVAAAVRSWVDVTAWSPARLTWARASPLSPAVTARSDAVAEGKATHRPEAGG